MQNHSNLTPLVGGAKPKNPTVAPICAQPSYPLTHFPGSFQCINIQRPLPNVCFKSKSKRPDKRHRLRRKRRQELRDNPQLLKTSKNLGKTWEYVLVSQKKKSSIYVVRDIPTKRSDQTPSTSQTAQNSAEVSRPDETPSTSQTAQNSAEVSRPDQTPSTSQTAQNSAEVSRPDQTPSTSQTAQNSAEVSRPDQTPSTSQTAQNSAEVSRPDQTPSTSQTAQNSAEVFIPKQTLSMSQTAQSRAEISRPDQTPSMSQTAQSRAEQVHQENQPKAKRRKIGNKIIRIKVNKINKKEMSAPWLNDGLRELIRMKHEARLEYNLNKTESNYKKFVSLLNTCNHQNKLAQKKYVAKNNSSDLGNKPSQYFPGRAGPFGGKPKASRAQVTGATVPPVFTRLEPKQPVAHQPPNDTIHVNTDVSSVRQPQLYSPTEGCTEQANEEGELEVPDPFEAGQKRLSAFDRLGPLTHTKKPKLTINLSLNKDQPVREVVEESVQPPYVPFHEREDVIKSTDKTVVKYLPVWPWKKCFSFKKTFTARPSKSVMLMEKEQVAEAYARENCFVLVSVKGYPQSWTKEDVLDVLLANLKGKSFIPCFIEFTKEDCKFFVNRSRMALLEIHALGFFVRHDDIELAISISLVHQTVTQLDFIPKAIIKSLVVSARDETKMDLKAFTLDKDLSHFIYFPLSRIYNQRELVQDQGGIDWKKITQLDLSHNRLKSLDGFNLPSYTPNLQSLDLSHNRIPTLPSLLSCRGVPLKRLRLEGNPLCLDYVDPVKYVEAVRMMFTSIRELDGEPIILQGEMPKFEKNFCPEEAVPLVEKYLETFFPLLDAPDRDRIENMYDKNAVLSITLRSKIRHNLENIRSLRYLFLKCRIIEQKVFDYVRGAANIKNVIEKWPRLMHDPTTFTVDVLHHTDDTTILKVTGILKILADSLAVDEHVLAFSRTVFLHTSDQLEYKIKHEMLYWDEPTKEYADSAFKLIRIRNKQLELKFDSTPGEEVQEELIDAFMKLTQLEAKPSRRCLEAKGWHFKNALEYFVKLLKLDNVRVLYKTDAR